MAPSPSTSTSRPPRASPAARGPPSGWCSRSCRGDCREPAAAGRGRARERRRPPRAGLRRRWRGRRPPRRARGSARGDAPRDAAREAPGDAARPRRRDPGGVHLSPARRARPGPLSRGPQRRRSTVTTRCSVAFSRACFVMRGRVSRPHETACRVRQGILCRWHHESLWNHTALCRSIPWHPRCSTPWRSPLEGSTSQESQPNVPSLELDGVAFLLGLGATRTTSVRPEALRDLATADPRGQPPCRVSRRSRVNRRCEARCQVNRRPGPAEPVNRRSTAPASRRCKSCTGRGHPVPHRVFGLGHR